MKRVAIIQARMSSTRLPGKVLKKICNIPMLKIQIERLKKCKEIDQIIVATTKNVVDDVIIELCKEMSIEIFRGSERDVLCRYFKAASHYQADIIVRLTSDCPLIDPKLVDEIIGFYCENRNHYEYVSNGIIQTYPRGMDIEVFSYAVLKRAFEESEKNFEREHVTPYVYNPENSFKVYNYTSITNLSKYRLTVDTKEDFTLIKLIFKGLFTEKGYNFSLEDIITFLNENKELLKINAEIQQKALTD